MNIFKNFILLSAAFVFFNKAIAQPTISSISPKSGLAGTLVTITGTNFNSVAVQNIVYFGAAKAVVTSASATTLTVKAPAGATYEPITVTSNSLTGYGDPFIIIFQGGGTIDSASFQSRKDFPVIHGGFNLLLNDFDGDGKTDIACENSGIRGVTGTFSVMPNTSKLGSVSFATKIEVSAGGTPYDIAIGDLNGDGKADLVFANYIFGNVFLSKNTSMPGLTSFAPAESVNGKLVNPMGINIADFDGDGRLDVLTVSGTASTVSILRNTGDNGNISFAPKVDFTTGGVTRVNVCDMDGDGKVDLVYNLNNSVTIFKNTSTIANISFNSQLSIPVSSAVLSIGDADGDSKPDLAITLGNNISIYRNTQAGGTVSFAAPVSYSMGSFFNQTYFSDIDGDAKPDLIGLSMTTNTTYVLKNKSVPGMISFAEKVGYATGGRILYAASGDLDGDSKPEIITYNLTDSISILRNKTGEPATVSSGANPVTGNVNNEVIVDETVQTYYGNPYVQRHYDIEPENNPGTSTATIILYFTQQEFNNFNAHPARSLSLPTGANDIAGKANLRVYQYHGTSATSTPGTYNGGGTEINPDDAKIIWNDLLKRWEVTFDVTGFSGFFVSSSSNAVLPLTLLSFNATLKDDKALFEWITTNEINVAYFELQRSTDGNNYNTVAKITAKGVGTTNTQYNSTDKPGEENNYYRLKIVDKDGSLKYSNILKINFPGARSSLSIFPNPAHGSVTIGTPVVSNQSELRLMDMTGRLVRVITIGKNSIQTKIDLHNVRPGTYKMLWTDGIKSGVQTFIVE